MQLLRAQNTGLLHTILIRPISAVISIFEKKLILNGVKGGKKNCGVV